MIKDRLYIPTYRYQHQTSCESCCSEFNPICEVATKAACEDSGCSDAYLVKRDRPGGDGDNLALYIGCLGSGNTVMRLGKDRDRISIEYGIIAFEMEGAGAWDEIPCIVVKGIYDFSDSTLLSPALMSLSRYVGYSGAPSSSSSNTSTFWASGSFVSVAIASFWIVAAGSQRGKVARGSEEEQFDANLVYDGLGFAARVARVFAMGDVRLRSEEMY